MSDMNRQMELILYSSIYGIIYFHHETLLTSEFSEMVANT